MDRKHAEGRHAAAVETWLERMIDDASPAEIVDQFTAAVEAVWHRALTTLGSVTLTAIADRVLFTATAVHPFLAAIKPEPSGDARWRLALQDQLADVPRPELIEGLRFGLTELLVVIGRLTAEILSHDLHAALVKLTLERGRARPPTGPHAEPMALRPQKAQP